MEQIVFSNYYYIIATDYLFTFCFDAVIAMVMNL
jgi:hypothetical protein